MSEVVNIQMRLKVVNMTPEWAQELLDKNHPRNRRPKEKRIAAYARDMRQGYWLLTPEPICIDVDGWLTNGQNRLAAVIRSESEVPMCIIIGCPKDSILGQDQGVCRNVSDVATISGNPLPHGAHNYAGVIRSMFAGTTAKTMTNQEVLSFRQEHSLALEFAFQCLPKNVRGITHAPVRAVIARAYYRRNLRNRTRTFCEYLISGLVNDPKADSGVIRLRNWLQDTFLGGVRSSRHGQRRAKGVVVYAKTERALKAFHDGEQLQVLQEMKRELFPLPGEAGEEVEAEKQEVS